MPSVVRPDRPIEVAPPPPPPLCPQDQAFRLLKTAQSRLESDPAAALALAKEFAQTCPVGFMQAEARVIRILALCKLDRRPEAFLERGELVREAPSHPSLPRIAEACGVP
ncbi:MAG: hypothetical protein QM765_30405 [Myxococcales bacterium]